MLARSAPQVIEVPAETGVQHPFCGSGELIHARSVPLRRGAERGQVERFVKSEHSPGRQAAVDGGLQPDIGVAAELREASQREPDAGGERFC